MFRFEYLDNTGLLNFYNLSIARSVTFDDDEKKIYIIYSDAFRVLCEYEGRPAGDEFYNYETAKGILEGILRRL